MRKESDTGREKHRADEKTEGGKRRGDGRLGERWSDRRWERTERGAHRVLGGGTVIEGREARKGRADRRKWRCRRGHTERQRGRQADGDEQG